MAEVGYKHWKNILKDYKDSHEALFALISIDGLDVSDEQKQEIINICKQDDFLMDDPDIFDIIQRWDEEVE